MKNKFSPEYTEDLLKDSMEGVLMEINSRTDRLEEINCKYDKEENYTANIALEVKILNNELYILTEGHDGY